MPFSVSTTLCLLLTTAVIMFSRGRVSSVSGFNAGLNDAVAVVVWPCIYRGHITVIGLRLGPLNIGSIKKDD